VEGTARNADEDRWKEAPLNSIPDMLAMMEVEERDVDREMLL
jgi:hypothetical protein